MKLPPPHDKLAGCVWLPRLLAKARGIRSRSLPLDYESRFCHPTGVDGQFLTHFSLTRDDIMRAALLRDEAVAEWFVALPGNNATRIGTWNEIATNLGRRGYPMEERFPVALATTYKHLQSRGLTSVFEILEADEQAE